jgi:hypothetical protein
VVRLRQGRLVAAQQLGHGVPGGDGLDQAQRGRHQPQQQEVRRARGDVEQPVRALDVEDDAQVAEVAHQGDAAAGVALEAQPALAHPGGGEAEAGRGPVLRRGGAGKAHGVEAARVRQGRAGRVRHGRAGGEGVGGAGHAAQAAPRPVKEG